MISDSSGIGIAVAFSAGLLSFVSPCVLPLVPSYLTFVTGMSLEDVRRSRQATLTHAILFVFGFSLIFIALGATASVVGRVLLNEREWVARIGGVLIIAFGLYLMGIFNLPAFGRDTRIHLRDKPIGYLGTVVVGLAFGAGWSPCLGPILGAILMYTATMADLHRGLVLLTAYSAGLAVPFLISAVAVEELIGFAQRHRARLAWLTRASGVVLVLVGLLLVSGYMTLLTGALQRITPAALYRRL
jgi:cytochrome c-type biogenesis protein